VKGDGIVSEVIRHLTCHPFLKWAAAKGMGYLEFGCHWGRISSADRWLESHRRISVVFAGEQDLRALLSAVPDSQERQQMSASLAEFQSFCVDFGLLDASEHFPAEHTFTSNDFTNND
jgi:hypothetical protein